MFSILIVDDEPMIRAGLQTLIDWEQYGFKIVGAAMNGKEAMSKYAELAPDLIIIDIRMPVMDGLQVIEEIRKTDSLCRFLILSGYADFEYAKRAIVGQVDGYILKPVDEEEMITELTRIRFHLQKQAEMVQLTSVQDTKRREDWIQALLVKDDDKQGTLPPDIASRMGPNLDRYQVLLLQIPSLQVTDSHGQQLVKGKLAHLFEEKGRGFVFSANSYVGVLLVDPVTDERKRKIIYEDIKSSLNDTLFFAAIGSIVKQITNVSVSYSEAAELLKEHFLFNNELIVKQTEEEPREKLDSLDIASLAEKMYYAMDMGNKESLEHCLERASYEIIAYERSEHGIKTYYAQLISIVLNKLAGLSDKTYTVVQNSMPMITDIFEQPNFETMQQRISSQLHELTTQISGSSNEPLLKQILDFIERHYNENLKLDTLAELFNYTSGYLGKIFKNYTGSHFHTYLDQIRIQKAIELLGEGLKVHQVALRVGYANADYFHSKFKKYVGESPSSFKGKSPKS